MKKRNRAFGRMQWFTSCISTTLVLLLLGLVVLFGLSAHELSRSVKENLTVTLLLDDDLDTDDAKAFEQRLQLHPYVHTTTLISKEQALEEERERLGTDPTEFLSGQNPYTASIEMTVGADYACTDSLIWIAKELKEMWQVADVIYQRDLVDNLNQTLHKAIMVLAVLAVLLMIISVVLINNTVRLSVYARRQTIHTMRLVGASWGFIRWPFIRRSLGIGLVAATIATALLLGIVHWARLQDAFVATIVTRQTIVAMVVTVYVAGLLLTFACTWLSVGHFLRMKENELYK
ncbi:MAG: permease-like cell division protein FtsX [Bacteroidaceae bacterium]|nr:permease-like cell division protein FtsX [Bacteroidaceae bacterium]MBR0433423.1 permease-like cell division protein FtsX [Bacteroidaceae bacterium]